MPTDVHAFFDSYRDAFNRLDGKAVSEHYVLPAMIAHAGGQGVFSDAAALDANNAALCEQYERIGFERAEFEPRAFVPQGSDFCVADLAWKITCRDQAPQCFNTSYGLSRNGGKWRIYCVTAYEERRPWTENE